MKKFNLFKEIIVADKDELMQAVYSGRSFGINTEGKICYEQLDANNILIYKGTPNSDQTLSTAFGRDYQVVEDNSRVLIKAFGAWQDIININASKATYNDTTTDGVDEFSTKEMEDIGWHATEFNITYRTLVDVLEEKCEGTLLCIEQEKPYQFSGLGFVDDLDNAKNILFDYCQEEVKRLISEDEDFAQDKMSDDELEAAKFFKAIA